jgi:hypothetical protein
MEDEVEIIEVEQGIHLFMFTIGLTFFNRLVNNAYTKMWFTVTGDNGEFILSNAQAALEYFHGTVSVITELSQRDEITTKDTYYELWFVVMEKVLPAVRAIENAFGHDVEVDGIPFSEACKEFIAKA